MENREAFTGILLEPEETIEEVNWRQNSYNQRGRGYSNRGSNRGSYRGNHYQPSQPPEKEVIILMVTAIQGVMAM